MSYVAKEAPAGDPAVLPNKYNVHRRKRAQVGFIKKYRTDPALRRQRTAHDPALDEELSELEPGAPPPPIKTTPAVENPPAAAGRTGSRQWWKDNNWRESRGICSREKIIAALEERQSRIQKATKKKITKTRGESQSGED